MPEPETYTDGVGIKRCKACCSALRQLDEAPISHLARADIEFILQQVEWEPRDADLVRRLHQAVGR